MQSRWSAADTTWLDGIFRGAAGEDGGWQAAADAIRDQLQARLALVFAIPDLLEPGIECGAAGPLQGQAQGQLARWLDRHRSALALVLRRQDTLGNTPGSLQLPPPMDPWAYLVAGGSAHGRSGRISVASRIGATGMAGLALCLEGVARPALPALSRQALRLCAQLGTPIQAGWEVRRLRTRLTDIQAMLTQWHMVLIHCDPRGQLVDALGPLDHLLLAYHPVVRVDRNRLQLTDRGAQLRLSRLLSGVAEEPPCRTGHSLSILAPGLPPLEFIILTTAATRSRLLIIRQQHGAPLIDRNYLRHRLGLTRVQADVLCRLMHGQDIATIAQARGSSQETIRGYLRALRQRLHCHTQAQLVGAGWTAIAHVPTAAVSGGPFAPIRGENPPDAGDCAPTLPPPP